MRVGTDRQLGIGIDRLSGVTKRAGTSKVGHAAVVPVDGARPRCPRLSSPTVAAAIADQPAVGGTVPFLPDERSGTRLLAVEPIAEMWRPLGRLG